MKSIEAVVAGLVVIAVASTHSSSSAPAQTTQLEIEIEGGFAYVYGSNPGALEIASLKDSGDECAMFVDQLGADLLVVSGNVIDSASSRLSKKFDLGGAVVTFPELEASTGQLTLDQPANRPATPCSPAGNPNDESYWTLRDSLSCTPRLTVGTPQSDFPNMRLKSNWREFTDGRLVLTRGSVTGMHPSDWTLKHTRFAFKRRLGNPTSPARVLQRLTDRIKVTATIPSDRVEMKLVDADANVPRTETAFSSILVQPTAPGRAVRLKLIGRHAHSTSPVLAVGEWVEHFCAFYALFDNAPPISEQLIPRVDQISVPPGLLPVAVAGGGQPSPGGVCPGMSWP